MRLYWELARRSFRRWSSYRGATVAGAFTNSVFGFIRAYVLLAVYQHRADVNGFDATDAVTFCFVSQGLLMLVSVFRSEMGLSERIRSGEVVADLARPVDIHAWYFAQDLGRASFVTIARGLPPVLAGALVFDLRYPAGAGRWLAFAVSLAAAFLVGFGVRFLFSLSAFWLVDDRGPYQLLTVMIMFFGGLIVPVTFFPHWLGRVAHLLPFASMLQVPIEVYLGKHTGADLAATISVQLLWAAALAVAARAVLSAASRRLVVHGG